MKKLLLFLTLTFFFSTVFAQDIHLEGEWMVKLDPSDSGLKENWQNKAFGDQTIILPGTLDDAGIGEVPHLDTTILNKEILTSLTRKHRYIGAAWYRKEISLPHNLDNAEILLERVLWKTDCWLDGRFLGKQESLSAPQQFYTGKLKAGKHTLVLRIDNRKQHEISLRNMAHAYTDGTQIIWNGVIGQMRLKPIRSIQIDELQIYPDLLSKSAVVKLDLKHLQKAASEYELRYQVLDQKNPLDNVTKTIRLTSGLNSLQDTLRFKSVDEWNEFNPRIYHLTVEIRNKKDNSVIKKESVFGFRTWGNKDGKLTLNGRPTFLRGTLDCDVYPLKGYAPMNKQGWIDVFTVARNYGLNHIRYHSWCPPEVAFEVADSLGFYLQAELPLWSLELGSDKATLAFLKAEAENIMKSYGNHPSFCFWSMGNEIKGDFDWLNQLVRELKSRDSRRLYTTTTFTFQAGHGKWPEPADDYFITQYTKKGWVRGQGIFNTEPPNFDTDYRKATEGLPVPLITHEVGQYSVFPNLREIDKYQGVLDPLNFKAIRHDMREKDLLHLADSFTLASGKFAVNLYKEEIERAMKTPQIGGFQLLDLHDFPGQGTALVGILDAFWESKNLIRPEEFRRFCSPVVPLIRFKKASYLNTESFEATVQLSNFSDCKLESAIEWEITDQDQHILFSGNLKKQEFEIGLSDAGIIRVPLDKIKSPEQVMIKIRLPQTSYQNSWTIWVYPENSELLNKGVLFTRSKKAALDALKQGKTVLLNPDTAEVIGVDGRFTSVFWSPVHFPNQPGSMGILCNPASPAFASFPTDFYSNWQWWDLIKRSKTMIIDSLPADIQPVVRVVDNFYKNRKMASILEGKVEKGKLIICSMDISTDLENRIEARQLRNSLLNYAGSAYFNPSTRITEAQLASIIK